MPTLKAARLHPAAILPTRKHPQDAGVDFYALEGAVLSPHTVAILRTGITVEIPDGMVGLLKPKGKSLHLLGAGVVDAGYQGEILIKVANVTAEPLTIAPGEAFAQMLLLPVFTPAVEEVSLEEIHHQQSERGATGGIVTQFVSQD